ncbi:hypothetical protein [Janthinobacterium sp. LB2P70]|uniref:hypothetical protein n=1 Tax=Janthinobacterium sp. LB2P70 TaxID=3424197 RepID=UPI003F28B989
MTILTLTGLIPDIYAAMNVIAREQVGFIPAVSRDSTAERAALNQTVRSPVVGAMAAEDLTQGAYAEDAGNQTINYVDMTISKQRSVPFGINGDDTQRLQSAGTYANINQQRIAQALRTLTNEVESDLAATSIKLSRAYGAVGTIPFGTAGDLSDFAQPKKILKDNGAPLSDLHMVLGSAAMANIEGKQSGLFRVNEAGTDDLLRRGAVTVVQGYDLHNSGAIGDLIPTGNAAAATTSNAGHAKGATVINLAAAGKAYLPAFLVGPRTPDPVMAGVALAPQIPAMRYATPMISGPRAPLATSALVENAIASTTQRTGMVETNIHIDGVRIGKAVTAYQTKVSAGPQSGIGRFDSSMAAPQPGISR